MTDRQKTIIGFAAGVAAGVSYGLNPLFGKPLLDGGVPENTIIAGVPAKIIKRI